MTSLSNRAGASVLALALTACGGAETRSELPYEEEDVSIVREARTAATGRTPVGRNFVGSRWQWVEATCTEGQTQLTERGFSDELRVEASDEPGYLLTHDEAYSDGCKRTILQSASPLEEQFEHRLTEEVVVGLPATPECASRPEPARVGELRMHGEFLEVLVRRSPLCNGFEVRHVYAPATPAMLTGEQIARRYVAHYNRRDVSRITRLFSDAGSLVDSFATNEDNSPTRHDGRDAVGAWYTRAFADVPWVALKLASFAPTDQEGQFAIEWDYMDPRLTTPFHGKNIFIVAAGEIFEAQFEVEAPAQTATTANAPGTATTPAGAAQTQTEETRPARRGRPAARRR